MAIKAPSPETNQFILAAGTILTPDGATGADARGPKISYKIQQQIRSVASHSFSYRAVLRQGKNETDQIVFVKTPRITPGTGEQNKKRLANIRITFQREYATRERLEALQDVSKYLGTGEHRLQSGEKLPFLAQSFVNGMMFDEYYQQRERENTGNATAFSGVKSSKEWFRMARALVGVIKRVHNQQIVHGDIGPRNVLLVSSTPGESRAPRPFVVDFGQSILLDQDSNRPGHKEANPKVIAYRPPEMDRAGSWQIPADIYGLGAILYFLASGSPPPPECKKLKTSLTELKAVIHGGIREANPTLLRDNEGIVKIVDKCLRIDSHDRYFCAENILADLDTFEFKQSESEPTHKRFDASVATIRRTFAKVITQNKLFGDIIQKNLDMLVRQSESMGRDHFEIYGDRDEIIDHLCRYLSTLRQGDEYLTVTQPSYWTKNNLGTNGRFFTMNKIMARRGVIIRRVFLVSDQDRKRDSQSSQILQAHQKAVGELEDEGIDVISKSVPHPISKEEGTFKGSFYTGFQKRTPQGRNDYFEKEGNHVALWRKTDGTMMSIIFSTRPVEAEHKRQKGLAQTTTNDQQIVKVRFWASSMLKRSYDDLKEICESSAPLSEFLAPVTKPRPRLPGNAR